MEVRHRRATQEELEEGERRMRKADERMKRRQVKEAKSQQKMEEPKREEAQVRTTKFSLGWKGQGAKKNLEVQMFLPKIVAHRKASHSSTDHTSTKTPGGVRLCRCCHPCLSGNSKVGTTTLASQG